MKPSEPVRRDARERAGGRVVGRDEQQVQQVVGRDLVVRVQVRRRRLEDVAARDGDRLREVGVVLEEHRRGHHLGDAGDRALALRVLFPEDLVGFGVVDDRGGGAKIRDEVAAARRPCSAAAPCRPSRGPSRPRARAPACSCASAIAAANNGRSCAGAADGAVVLFVAVGACWRPGPRRRAPKLTRISERKRTGPVTVCSAHLV